MVKISVCKTDEQQPIVMKSDANLSVNYTDGLKIVMAKQNDDADVYHCPGLGKEIDAGLCWELCFAGNGGPTDTSVWLEQWIEKVSTLDNVDQFHQICAGCSHCQRTDRAAECCG